MPAAATTNETAPAAIGASRSLRSWALIAPCTGSAAPAARASASPATRGPIAPRRPPSVRTIAATATITAAAPTTCATPGTSRATPSQPKPSRASEASIWPVIQRPTVSNAPSLGNSRMPEVMYSALARPPTRCQPGASSSSPNAPTAPAAAVAASSSVAPMPSWIVAAPNGLPVAALSWTFAAACKASRPPTARRRGMARASMVS